MNPRKVSHWLILCLAVLGAVRLHRAAMGNSEDFSVYWNAVHQWMDGRIPYVFSAENHGFVFKYPPWMLVLFLPLGWIPFELARSVWVFIQVFFIFYSISWAIDQGVSRRTALLVAAGFWWIWLAHASAGQITELLLVCGLWALGGNAEKATLNPFRKSLLLLVFSSKVFSLFSLAGIWKDYLKKRTLITIGLLFAVLNFIVIERLGGFGSGDSGVLRSLYMNWVRAAASGGAELGSDVVRGQGNHGFTAGVLRWLAVDSTWVLYDIGVACLLAGLLGFLWVRFSSALSLTEKWAGWLALGLIVHPLAWHHSFVLAYPLCALSLDRSIRSGSKKMMILSFLGMSCIGLLIPQTIGKVWVKPLELVSVKSWGVVFAAMALVWSHTRIHLNRNVVSHC